MAEYKIIKGRYATLKPGQVVTENEIFDDFMLSCTNLNTWNTWLSTMLSKGYMVTIS